MKTKVHAFFTAILIAALCSHYGHARETTLLVIHPTAYNMESVAFLAGQGMIDATDLQVVGVYYANENYDYSQTREFIREENLANFSLRELSDSIPENKVYAENALSDDFRKLFNNSHGVLFFGGPDLPPSLYGEQTNLLTNIYDPQRHFFEVSFLAHLLGTSKNSDLTPLLAEKENYVVYGFCLGMQTMNVATGGSMIQDIPTEVYGKKYMEETLEQAKNQQHRNYQKRITYYDHLLSGNFHQVAIEHDAIAGAAYSGKSPLVLSNHHQAIDATGLHLKRAAASTDGKITEALVHQTYPNVLGVQFHPEPKYIYKKEETFYYSLNGQELSGPEILKEKNSMEFHQAFWQQFSRKLKKATAQQ